MKRRLTGFLSLAIAILCCHASALYAADAAKNDSHFVSTAKNVCDYVAQAYNQGKMESISVPEGEATGDGLTVHFSPGCSGCHCPQPELHFKELENNEITEENLKRFSFATQEEGELIIVPFHGKYYTLSNHDDGPDRLVDPNQGPLCDFKRHYEPALAEDREPKLCKAFVAGKLKHNVKWTPAGDNIESPPDASPINDEAFDRVAEIDLTGDGHKMHVGHLAVESGVGCGCQRGTLEMLKGNKAAEEAEQPNKSLLDTENHFLDCRGADTNLIEAGGKVYVEAWGGFEGASSGLIKFADGKFQTVCRVKQRLTVTPVPPKTESSEDNGH